MGLLKVCHTSPLTVPFVTQSAVRVNKKKVAANSSECFLVFFELVEKCFMELKVLEDD